MARTHTAAHGPRAAPRARAHAQGASEFSQGELHTPSPRDAQCSHHWVYPRAKGSRGRTDRKITQASVSLQVSLPLVSHASATLQESLPLAHNVGDAPSEPLPRSHTSATLQESLPLVHNVGGAPREPPSFTRVGDAPSEPLPRSHASATLQVSLPLAHKRRGRSKGASPSFTNVGVAPREPPPSFIQAREGGTAQPGLPTCAWQLRKADLERKTHRA